MQLGNTSMDVKPIGLGCWAIGGPFTDNGAPCGWGDVSDKESLQALKTGIDMGVNFIDTANLYGAGHSEVLVGKVIAGRRSDIFLTTKFGILIDEEKKMSIGQIANPTDIKKSCEDSLRRLQTDYIDLFLFHLGDYEADKAIEVRDTLELLVKSGKIRYYGWSTPDTERAEVFADAKNCIAMEFAENVMEDNFAMRKLCHKYRLAEICRSPLAMGLLTGKYNSKTSFSKGDLRGKDAPAWMRYYVNGKPNAIMLKKLDAIREILTTKGRSLAQGCISWIWGCDERSIPIPGFKTEAQVRDNVLALEFGPLTGAQVAEVNKILGGMQAHE